jgi:hypothetical protein
LGIFPLFLELRKTTAKLVEIKMNKYFIDRAHRNGTRKSARPMLAKLTIFGRRQKF